MFHVNGKKLLIFTHDLVATALAVLLTLVVRFDDQPFADRVHYLPAFLPFFVAYAAGIYWFYALYQSKWRFASLPDLSNIVRASAVLAVTLLAVDYALVSPLAFGNYFFGKIAIGLYWLLQIALLGGPRLAYRYLKYKRSRNTVEREATTPTLLVGRGSDIEVLLRAIESGSVQRIRPLGIISPRAQDQGQSIRGVPVLGGFADLEQVAGDFQERAITIRRLVATPSALAPEARPEELIARARRLGIPLSRVTSVGEDLRDAEIAPLEIEDLILRPTVEIDRARLANFIQGKRVLVTGGGGSIGGEICARVAAFGASHLLVVESSEPALHQILEAPSLIGVDTRVEGVIADVRDRKRVREVMGEFRPDVVFHAAGLKHVPYLEKDWEEGVKTNVFGSVNVADAAVESGARTCVLISTDKAIEPVSVLGVTKRFAEMYTQALDAEYANGPDAPRLIAVRFGNVLSSVGSVVPKFKAQIARGGPVTVTHPDMVRYFMTIREASDLVLTAASHADADGPSTGVTPLRPAAERASVYVLKMGQPVRIYDLAEHMIRLAGYAPGVEIDIAIVGARPGERLHEILFHREEPMADTGIDGVMAAQPVFADRTRVDMWLRRLEGAVKSGDRGAADAVFEEAIPEFKRRAQRFAPAAKIIPMPQAAGRAQAS